MTKKFQIPWAVWRDPKFLEIRFPDSWEVVLCGMNNAPDLSDEEIKKRVLNPIGTARLSEMARGKENVVIVVDDTT